MSDGMGNFLKELSSDQKENLKQMIIAEQNDTINNVDNITVTNKAEKKMPDVIIDNNSNVSDMSKQASDTKTEYIERKHSIKQIGTVGQAVAKDIVIDQRNILGKENRVESTVVPKNVQKHPLTSGRGGSQTEADTLDRNFQVADTFFDPNTKGSAEAKYNREGGRVKHAAASNDILTSASGVQGGSLNKGFDPNSDSDAQSNGSKFLMTGFNVKVDNQSISVSQGFESIDQAIASVDGGIFLLNHGGLIKMSKVIEGTPTIKSSSGEAIFVYNNDEWKKV